MNRWPVTICLMALGLTLTACAGASPETPIDGVNYCAGQDSQWWASATQASEVTLVPVGGPQSRVRALLGGCEVRVSTTSGHATVGVQLRVPAPGLSGPPSSADLPVGWCSVTVNTEDIIVHAGGLDFEAVVSDAAESVAGDELLSGLGAAWTALLGCEAKGSQPEGDVVGSASEASWRRTDIPRGAGLSSVSFDATSGPSVVVAAVSGEAAKAWFAGWPTGSDASLQGRTFTLGLPAE